MKRSWNRWLMAVASGAVLLQTATCAEQVTAVSSVVTAGGVVFIINEIVN